MTCYLESIAPHDFPGGGGFSICNYTLSMLYKENLVCNNYWTVGNDNMPLIRYLGCTMTLYTQPEVDYLFYYNNSYPMVANKLTYMSTHPQIMLQTKHVKVIRCRKYTKNRRPFKKFFISPPSQMQNKWYFQHDLADIPLLQTMCTVCSLDRTFLHANAISTTMGFISLDVTQIQNHNFTDVGTTGYLPIHNEKLFAAPGAHPKIETIPIGDLIFLGNTDSNQEGTPIKSIPNSGSFQNKILKALTQPGFQGNPFYKEYLHPDTVIVKTTLSTGDLQTNYTNTTDKLKPAHFSIKQPLTINCRYNPFADKGTDNKVYLLKTSVSPHSDDWTPPGDADLIWSNLPLWLLTWGFLDYQKKCGTLSQIDTNTILVIASPYIQPKDRKIYVPIDYNFTVGSSPYENQHLIPSDYFKWHPKVRFQVQTVNNIGCTGPFTVKLPENISCEAHVGYKFHFKIGGEPAPMSILTNPSDQPKYNIPNNLLQTTSLQNPTTPIESYLWKFDERRGQLTKKAAQRITTDWETEKTLFSITDPSTYCPTTSKKEIQTTDSSTSEEEETSIETQLLHERRKQRLLRKRINKLLNRLAILE